MEGNCVNQSRVEMFWKKGTETPQFAFPQPSPYLKYKDEHGVEQNVLYLHSRAHFPH